MVVTDATNARGLPKVLLNRKGEHVYNPEVVLACFSQHFVGVLGGGRDLNDQVREQLDVAMRNVRRVLLTQGYGIRVSEGCYWHKGMA
jgi:hypothetical protein